MDRIMYADSYRKKVYGLLIVIAFTLIITAVYFTPAPVKADTSITVTEINYLNSTITLKVNASDTKVYFSDSKKKTWEEVPGTISGSNTITMDISWITATSNYVLNFKGDYSKAVVAVTLPKQVTNFKATYNKSKGSIVFSKTANRTIEWRKKDSSVWNTVNTDTISTELNYMCNEGATVIFRLAPINGTSASSVGNRASKEVSIAVPAKSSAPSVKIDGSSLSIYVTKGEAYRTVKSDGSASSWITIARTQKMPLSELASAALYTNAGTAQSEVTLQFRMNASSTKQVSKITTVTVPIQSGPPSADACGMSLSYTSSSTLALKVKGASSTIPFEYTIVEEDEELDYLTASWTSITSGSEVTLNDDSAPKGSHIYVRKKSVAKTDTVDFALASDELDLSGSTGVTYPGEPSASTLTTLISTIGAVDSSDSSTYLSFTLYSAVSTTVSSIKLLDAYGVDKGTLAIKSTVAANSSSTGGSNAYIITTKITSTDGLVTGEMLYAKMTLANSDVITSSDTAGIRLYLYPTSKVNNPDASVDTKHEYTDKFKRIYLSNYKDDSKSFKFRLDLGTVSVPSSTEAGASTATGTAISAITYQDYYLIAGTDYTVEYGSYVDDDNKTVRTATVTVNVDKFEASSLLDVTDIAEPLLITLNDGEKLKDDIYITLVNTATLSKKMSWTITEGKLKETQTVTTTTSGGSTTSTVEELISYTLTLALFDSNYTVSVSDVTWGGISVLGSTTITNGTATVNLSNAKLNKLSTDSSTTKNLVISFSNGFSITSGCSLTVLNNN